MVALAASMPMPFKECREQEIRSGSLLVRKPAI
jgi:hypothetical protein